MLLILAALMATGCRFPVQNNSDSVPCNVVPDDVFGRHYTAADFQIWGSSDKGLAQMAAGMAVREKGISSSQSGWRVTFATADTAAVGTMVRELCSNYVGGDTICRYGWMEGVDSGMCDLITVVGTHPLIDGTAIAKAWVETEWEMPVVVFEFKKEHWADFQSITGENIGYVLPFMLGDRVLSAPVVNAEITGGRCSFMGPTEEECCAIAAIINGGKDPE